MWVVADLDEDYITKMEDVLEVYERPYDQREPVVCLDEKPITLHADVRPASPAAPGREARRDNEYERCGTANVFCAVEPKAGRHFTFPTPDRSGFEFARVTVELALAYPEARTIHLVMDNLNIHRQKALADVFGAEMTAQVWDRFTVHYTPTHGSWLNQAEIEIGLFSRQCLGKRRIPNLKILKAEARAWNRRMNRDRVKIIWKFDRRAARRKFGYKCQYFTRSKNYLPTESTAHISSQEFSALDADFMVQTVHLSRPNRLLFGCIIFTQYLTIRPTSPVLLIQMNSILLISHRAPARCQSCIGPNLSCSCPDDTHLLRLLRYMKFCLLALYSSFFSSPHLTVANPSLKDFEDRVPDRQPLTAANLMTDSDIQ